MSLIGKKVRLERIMNRETKRTLIIPMDHGITVGPIKGLNPEEMSRTVNEVAWGGANAVLGHVGLPLYGHRGYGPDIGLIIHLSGATTLSPNPNKKVLVNTVEDAIKFGADAVSIHVNIGDEDESEMLSDLGMVSRQCREWGYPLLAMMYPRGAKIDDEHGVEFVKIAARAASELGADIVKTNYTGDIDSFKEVTTGALCPVIIAGGPKNDGGIKSLLETTRDSIIAGGAGVAFGRNIFQHKNPRKLTEALVKIIHEDRAVDEVLREYKDFI
ncbi:MAG: fructose-bisphosphate aldolase [Candidatus Lokiarchaeota archaeon]|nr:fructose-bisphosphate aldolase [Candidatus Lokiarchaeota archaeon]